MLSKADLNEAIAQYPQAQAILKRRAQSVMRRNRAREIKEHGKLLPLNNADVVIANPVTPPTTPKLLETVIKALPEESPAVQLLTRGSKKRTQIRRASSVPSECISMITDECADKPVPELKTLPEIQVSKDRESPDLLQEIESALAKRNKHMNLTDSEKALIVTQRSEMKPKDSTDCENFDASNE